jgi:hypothetical protein
VAKFEETLLKFLPNVELKSETGENENDLISKDSLSPFMNDGREKHKQIDEGSTETPLNFISPFVNFKKNVLKRKKKSQRELRYSSNSNSNSKEWKKKKTSEKNSLTRLFFHNEPTVN